MVFQQKLVEKASFIFKLTGRAKVQPASSDKWKAPKSKDNLTMARADLSTSKLSTGGRAQSFPQALASYFDVVMSLLNLP